MARIQQLPTSVVTKIAAGEVIERPASVVKELLENSVDAGSKRIDIEVEEGGTERIRIIDDGGGIEADDLPLAFSPHATSKLRSADDLFQIATLGFRGEALASIGGVAQVTIQSRPADQSSGASITCNGGELSAVQPWNGSPGTRIEVKHLFYNTPVRKKFLRKTPTEMGHISETFTRLALATSGIRDGGTGLHLTLRHNNKPVHDIPSTAKLLDRISVFLSSDIANQMYYVESQRGPAKLVGYLADPACDRGNSRMQYLFLNGRWIRDRSLGHAIQEAYRGLLMTSRYAIAVLFLELPSDHVDVNVHPTKSEVRFRDSQAAHHLVFTALRDRLREANLTARLQVPTSMPPPRGMDALPPPPLPTSSPSSPTKEDDTSWFRSPPTATPGEIQFPGSMPRTPGTPMEPPPSMETAPPPSTTDVGAPEPMQPPSTSPPPPLPPGGREASATTESAPVPMSQRSLQLYDSYIVLETNEGMLVIDQHALHERILFEQLQKRLRSGTLQTQRLLIPEPVQLTAEQAAITLDHQEALAELGLGVEDFGGNTILVTSYPAMLDRRSPESILRTVVDHLVTKDRPPSREVLFNDLLSLMACHSAVRAGDRLTSAQIEGLLEQRHLVDDQHHCPHGRPTALLFSRQELEKQFGRI